MNFYFKLCEFLILPFVLAYNLRLTTIYLFIFRESTSFRLKINSEKWTEHARTAFTVDPRIAFSLGARFPTNISLKAELTQLVQVAMTILNIISISIILWIHLAPCILFSLEYSSVLHLSVNPYHWSCYAHI